ncbi:MAG: Na+/H+ antiporter subunit E [Deltaproteobacteria bacterium]|nr:MAG: Na+/H+ antiporter subunit E [Deltaproteobacteria bacterium]
MKEQRPTLVVLEDAPDHPWRLRLFPQPITSIAVGLTWLLLVNSVHPAHLTLAALLGVIVPHFSSPFMPIAPQVRSWWALLSFAPIFLFDLVIANISVAILILRIGYVPRSRWITIPLDARDPFAITTLAAVISLTPGTVSSRLTEDRRFLLVHVLDCNSKELEVEKIKARYEAPIRRIFES